MRVHPAGVRGSCSWPSHWWLPTSHWCEACRWCWVNSAEPHETPTHRPKHTHTHTHTHTHKHTPGVTNERIHSYVENKVDSVRWLPSSHILSTTTVLQAHSTTHWTCEVFKSDGVFRLAWAQDSSGVLALTEYSVGRSRRCTVNFSRWCSTAGARCVLCPTPWGPDSSSRGR